MSVPALRSVIRYLVRRVEFWGLLLRALLMPLGACWDLYHNYLPAHTLVYHGYVAFHFWGGATAVHPLTYLHAGWLWVLKVFFGFPNIWNDAWSPSPSDSSTWIDLASWEHFLQMPGAPVMIAELKFPYLVAEVLMIVLLTSLVDQPQRRQVARFLWLNPISLYAITLFGGWDVIPCLGVALAMAAILRGRPVLGAWLLGCATALKLYPLLFLPFLLLFGAKTLRKRMLLASGAVAPLGGLFVLAASHQIPLMAILLQTKQVSYPLSMRWVLIHHSILYPFIIGVTLLILHAVHTRANTIQLAEALPTYSVCVLLLLFSFSFFHVQYFLWWIPLFALCLPILERWRFCFGVQVVGFFIYLVEWGRSLTTHVFAAIHPTWILALPSPQEVIGRWCPAHVVTGIGHSMLAGGSLWMIWMLLKQPMRRIK